MFPVWPSFDEDDISVASEVLTSGLVNYWTGEQGKLFESEFSNFCGTEFSIAVANGSVALSLAYRALGISISDEVITTSRTFIATASEAILLGARIRFADVDLISGCITAQTIEPLITPKTKAIVVVHFAGWPADMHSICSLASSYKLPVIEDCSQAHGAMINGQAVGSFGDISTWSFCQDKIISTGGEGGIVSTSNKDLYLQMWSFKDHGKSFDAVFNKTHPPGFRWLHESFGTNFRLTEFQSALGRLQLRKLPVWTSIRAKNAEILSECISVCNCVITSAVPNNLVHAWYKFYCRLNLKCLSSDWSRDRIVAEINSLGYPAFHGGCSEIYLEKCFSDISVDTYPSLPIASLLGASSLMFVLHPTISPDQMYRYGMAIRSILFQAESN